MVREGTNDNLAQEIIAESLKFPLRLISFVGKPFYLALVAVIYSLYITGYFFRVVSRNSINYLVSIMLTISTDLPRQIWRKNVLIFSWLFALISNRLNTKLGKSIFKNSSSTAIEIQNLRQIKKGHKVRRKRNKTFNHELYLNTFRNILLFSFAVFNTSQKKLSKKYSKFLKLFTNTVAKKTVNSTVEILLKLVQIIKWLKLNSFSSKVKFSKKIKHTKASLSNISSKILKLPTKLVQLFKIVTGSTSKLLNVIKLPQVFFVPKKVIKKIIPSSY